MEIVLVLYTYCGSLIDLLTAVPQLNGKIWKASCSR